MAEKMRAIVYERYGDPTDVLEMREVDIPQIGDDEVLVGVHTCAVNPLDWHLITGTPRFARLSFGVRAPKQTIRGNDIAGTVEAVGKDVSEFRVGDEVFGETHGGGFAEHVAVPARQLVRKPAKLSFEEAASVPVAAFTALQGLRDWGGMKAGDDVLVVGASGGVGTYAVQIARALGAAHVTAVCSTRNVDQARALGADTVIDYTREDFADTGRRYNVIFDVPANRSLFIHRRLLAPGGTYVMVGGKKSEWIQPLPRLIGARVLSILGYIRVGNGVAKTSHDDLLILRDWLEAGRINSVIDRNYKLDETADALEYQGTFHARGKIIVTI